MPTYSLFQPFHVPGLMYPKGNCQSILRFSRNNFHLTLLRSKISRNFLCFFQLISTKSKKTQRKTQRIPYYHQYSQRMLTEGGNKPRNVHPAHQVLSTLHMDPVVTPCSYSHFPQESHHSSTEHSTNWNPNKQGALRGKDSALLAGQVNYVHYQDFCQRQSRFFPARGAKKDTLHQKVSESAPVKLSRCNFFCSNQTLFVSSYPIQNKTGKNNLLTDDTFFLKNCLPFSLLFLSHFHVIEIATDIRKQLCCTHPITMPQLHKSLPAALWKAET